MATLSKNLILPKEMLENEGVVVLPLKKYEELRRQAIPTYYLEGKEAKEADKLVKEGLKEYRAGKCKKIKSLADLD